MTVLRKRQGNKVALLKHGKSKRIIRGSYLRTMSLNLRFGKFSLTNGGINWYIVRASWRERTGAWWFKKRCWF